jgi:predicted nuclease of restriction endonuclease-like (RecB) superfamily
MENELDALANGAGYSTYLAELKERIRRAQIKAALAVNRDLFLLYWSIGTDILTRQREQGWGTKIIERLSADLRREFPEMKGFSSRNLKYMRSFAKAWDDELIVQQVVAQLPWGHNVIVLDKVKTETERLWYAKSAIEFGWSRNVLVHQIETKLYERQGKAITNFERTLPAPTRTARRIDRPYSPIFAGVRQRLRVRRWTLPFGSRR